MSDIQTEIRTVRKQIAEMRNMMRENAMVNDLVNRKQAIEITGLTPGSFSTYLSKKYFTVICTNDAGQEFFSRKQLTGFKEQNLKIA